jgi:lysozyme family protein
MMQHPFSVLKNEYTHLLSVMEVRPECRELVDKTAVKLIQYKTRYQQVTDQNGVPVIFIASSFEREGSSNFNLNPAQGASLHSISRIIPHNGPFKDWTSAALAAYKLNGLDRVGTANWTWELMCFYGETFNGWGPRDWHHQHTSYLWGGTNIQTAGKYVRDGVWDGNVMDTQLGTIPVARRMVEIDPTLALPKLIYVPAPPVASGVGVAAEHPEVDAKWVAEAINKLGQHPPIAVNGNYDHPTMLAVEQFQRSWGLHVDGLAGNETITALKAALVALAAEPDPTP